MCIRDSFSSSRLRLHHYSPSEFSSADLFLDDCQSSNSKTPPRLNSCSSNSPNNSPKSKTPHSSPPTLLATWASKVFDEHLTFSDQISSVSKPCDYHIRQLRSMHPPLYLDSKTASTIATSIVHSKVDYCNSLYYSLATSQNRLEIARLQQIQNSLACAVVKAPKTCHITPILQSLHWLIWLGIVSGIYL